MVHDYALHLPERLGEAHQIVDDDDDEIYFGQGYRYTLRDQDAFCLVQCKAACSENDYRGRKILQ